MRVDLFLKKARIFNTRSIAKIACEKGKVAVNGKLAKPSTQVREGDRLKICFPTKEIEGAIVGIPLGNVKKSDSSLYFSVERERRLIRKPEEDDFWKQIWEEVD